MISGEFQFGNVRSRIDFQRCRSCLMNGVCRARNPWIRWAVFPVFECQPTCSTATAYWLIVSSSLMVQRASLTVARRLLMGIFFRRSGTICVPLWWLSSSPVRSSQTISLSLRFSCRHCVSIANSPLQSHQSPTLLLTTCQTLSLSPKTVGWWSVPSKRNRSFSKHLEGILPLLKNKQPNTINKKNIQFRRLLHLLHACSTMLALAQWTLLIELPVPRALGCVWHFSVCKLRIRIRYGQQVAAWFLWCVQSMWMHFADALVRQCPGNESQCIARRCEHQPLCWQGRSLDRPIGGAVNYKYNER